MNKSDLKLIIVIIIIGVILLFILNLQSTQGDNVVVYYENDVVLNASLEINNTYTVSGYNGDVVIEVKDKKVRVNEENSPKHLCSKQGWISSSYESIICLPNKIVVKIEATSEIDAIVK